MREYRGVSLIGDKPKNKIWAIRVVNNQDHRIALAPAEYRIYNVSPTHYESLPWEEDVNRCPTNSVTAGGSQPS